MSKIWVADDYDYGIEHAFGSREGALNYLLSSYVKRLVPRMLSDEEKRKSGEIEAPKLGDILTDDIKNAVERLYIEDFMYIHELEIEE